MRAIFHAFVQRAFLVGETENLVHPSRVPGELLFKLSSTVIIQRLSIGLVFYHFLGGAI